MEERLPLVQCPVQVLPPTADPHAFRGQGDWSYLWCVHDRDCRGMVPFLDQMPEVFAETILAFLARKYPAR